MVNVSFKKIREREKKKMLSAINHVTTDLSTAPKEKRHNNASDDTV